ncbi:superinfection immunity protein [Actinomadura sp. 9N215]|uniref:superinfection immunity protein n=1 Tax=Actinomadura sp. 9N215 TaxID=3375150 RepID=UPI0037C0FCEC
MSALQNSIYFWLALIGLLAFLAVLPTLIALARGVDDIAIIMLFNAICCTTVFGWPIALFLAIRWPRRNPAPRPTSLQRRPAEHRANHESHIYGRGPGA